MKLTREEFDNYNRNGFLIKRNLFSNNEIEKISIDIDSLAGKTPIFGKEMLYKYS